MGSIAFFLARKKGHNPYFWFMIGFLLGLVGIFFLFLPPKKRKSSALSSPKAPHPMLSKFWYYLNEDNSQVGPMSSSSLLALWEKRKITEETYVWSEDLPDWKLFGELGTVFNQENGVPREASTR